MGVNKVLAGILLFLLLTHLSHTQRVDVGIYLLDISKFDVRTGQFTADFYIDFKCKDNCSPENFEFMNGRADTIDLEINNSDEKFYRIHGTFGGNVNLEKYPLDAQTMNIVLEDKLTTKDRLYYVALENESGIDDSIAFPGWNIRNWTARVDDHYYPPYGETYSRYTFSVNVERIALNAILKTFFPLFFIILITLASLYLSPKDMGFRITIGGSTLITTVLLHISILSEIPATPYLTYADKFMFVTYSILLLSFLDNIAIQELLTRGRNKDAEIVQSYTEIAALVIPLICILVFYLLL